MSIAHVAAVDVILDSVQSDECDECAEVVLGWMVGLDTVRGGVTVGQPPCALTLMGY
jgi:hypothetical protein